MSWTENKFSQLFHFLRSKIWASRWNCSGGEWNHGPAIWQKWGRKALTSPCMSPLAPGLQGSASECANSIKVLWIMEFLLGELRKAGTVAFIISVFFRDQHICFAKAKQQGRSQSRVRAQSSLREPRCRAHLQGRAVVFSFVTKLLRIFPFSPKII